MSQTKYKSVRWGTRITQICTATHDDDDDDDETHGAGSIELKVNACKNNELVSYSHHVFPACRHATNTRKNVPELPDNVPQGRHRVASCSRTN
jgi:hypothetical protein